MRLAGIFRLVPRSLTVVNWSANGTAEHAGAMPASRTPSGSPRDPSRRLAHLRAQHSPAARRARPRGAHRVSPLPHRRHGRGRAAHAGVGARRSCFDELQRCFDDPAAADAFPGARSAASPGEAGARPPRAATPTSCSRSIARLPSATQAHVRRWVGEMIVGMRKFVLLYPHGIRIQSLDEYKEYCYYVAGTVGYLLTDLWHEHAPSIGARRYGVLREKCRAFAEALQTVNILKDVATRRRARELDLHPGGAAPRSTAARTRRSSRRIALRGTRDALGHAGAARLARSRERAQLPAAHPAPRRLDPPLLRAAAAVRLRDAARSHAHARTRSCAARW